MAEPTCIHAVPQAADQLHGICIFCYRDRLGAARAENAALRERVAVLERVREAADLACRQYAGRRGPVLIPMEALGRLLGEMDAAKPAAQEGKEQQP